MGWHVIYTPEAQDDLRDISEYIAFELQEPGTAYAMLNRITSAIRSLDILPFRYPFYDNKSLFEKDVRYFAVAKYLVFYYTDETDESVNIVRIIYGGRDLPAQFDEPEKSD